LYRLFFIKMRVSVNLPARWVCQGIKTIRLSDVGDEASPELLFGKFGDLAIEELGGGDEKAVIGIL
jgi:hypothetical protein